MSILDRLICDRTEEDKARLNAIRKKLADGTAWDELTEAERFYWMYGDAVRLYAADGPLYAADGPLYVLRDGQPRGAYNYVDLNRVEEAVQYLAEGYRTLPEDLRAHAVELEVAWSSLFDVPYDPADFALTTKTDWTVSDLQKPSDMDRYLSNVKALTQGLEADYPALPEDMESPDWEDANAIETALRVSGEALEAERTRITELVDNTAATVDLGWALGLAHTGLYGGI